MSEEATKKLAEATDLQIAELFGVDILMLPTTREGLKKLHFNCPICKQKKTADNLVIVQKPLKFKHELKGTNYEIMVSQEQLLCCSDCNKKYFPVSEADLHE